MQERHHSLDFLRGLCALGVAAYHFLAWHHDIPIQSLGTFGVYTFFVLSALTMMMRYATDFVGHISAETALAFYKNRIARVLPLLAVVTLISLTYFNLKSGNSAFSGWQKTLLPGSGLFALHMPGLLSNTVGAWSLGIEIAFYVSFPIICLLAMTASTRVLTLVTFALIVAQQLLLRQLPPANDPEFWVRYVMPLTFAPFFAIGVLIYRGTTRQASLWYLLAGLAALSTVFAFSSVVSANVFRPGWAHLTLMGLCGLAVMFMYQSTLPAWLAPIGVFIGEISYSLYLTHWLAYQLVKEVAAVPVSVAFGATAMALAICFTYLLERPARRLIGRRTVRTAVQSA